MPTPYVLPRWYSIGDFVTAPIGDLHVLIEPWSFYWAGRLVTVPFGYATRAAPLPEFLTKRIRLLEVRIAYEFTRDVLAVDPVDTDKMLFYALDGTVKSRVFTWWAIRSFNVVTGHRGRWGLPLAALTVAAPAVPVVVAVGVTGWLL